MASKPSIKAPFGFIIFTHITFPPRRPAVPTMPKRKFLCAMCNGSKPSKAAPQGGRIQISTPRNFQRFQPKKFPVSKSGKSGAFCKFYPKLSWGTSQTQKRTTSLSGPIQKESNVPLLFFELACIMFLTKVPGAIGKDFRTQRTVRRPEAGICVATREPFSIENDPWNCGWVAS